MTVDTQGFARRRGALVALVTAGGILLVLVAQRIIESMSLVGFYGMTLFDSFGVWRSLTLWLLSLAVPFAVGVFVTLWVVVPIAAESRLVDVVPRALLAAVGGALLVFLMQVVVAIAQGVSFPGPLFGPMFPFAFDRWGLLSGLGSAAHAAIAMLATTAPLVVLAAMFQWLWLRERAAKHPTPAMMDEV